MTINGLPTRWQRRVAIVIMWPIFMAFLLMLFVFVSIIFACLIVADAAGEWWEAIREEWRGTVAKTHETSRKAWRK